MDIVGIAHIQLSVTDFRRSSPFYRALCEHFGMKCQYDVPQGSSDSDNTRAALYHIGGKTGLLIRPVDPEYAGETFHQYKPGLHHLCFRARSREDIDAFCDFFNEALEPLGGKLIHGPEEGQWASGYYSLLFEDPDGIRLEINHVPGKGNLDPAVKLPLAPL